MKRKEEIAFTFEMPELRAQIARDLRCSVSEVDEAIDALIAHGHLRVLAKDSAGKPIKLAAILKAGSQP